MKNFRKVLIIYLLIVGTSIFFYQRESSSQVSVGGDDSI